MFGEGEWVDRGSTRTSMSEGPHTVVRAGERLAEFDAAGCSAAQPREENAVGHKA